jgi:hypothetical protein
MEDTFDLNSIITRLIKTYPAFYTPIVKQAEDWILEDGSILLTVLFGSLAGVVKENINNGHYEHLDRTFDLFESMLTNKNKDISAAVATGFLEGLNHREDASFSSQKYAGLLGPVSKDYLRSYDKLHGIDPDDRY